MMTSLKSPVSVCGETRQYSEHTRIGYEIEWAMVKPTDDGEDERWHWHKTCRSTLSGAQELAGIVINMQARGVSIVKFRQRSKGPRIYIGDPIYY